MYKNSKCETALTWMPEGRRKVGRPKATWQSNVDNERRNEAICVSADIASLRRCTLALWPTSGSVMVKDHINRKTG